LLGRRKQFQPVGLFRDMMRGITALSLRFARKAMQV